MNKAAWIQILHDQNEQNNFFPWSQEVCWDNEEFDIIKHVINE